MGRLRFPLFFLSLVSLPKFNLLILNLFSFYTVFFLLFIVYFRLIMVVCMFYIVFFDWWQPVMWFSCCTGSMELSPVQSVHLKGEIVSSIFLLFRNTSHRSL